VQNESQLWRAAPDKAEAEPKQSKSAGAPPLAIDDDVLGCEE
jgi:hypothetical protein